MNAKEQYIRNIFQLPEPYSLFNILTRDANYHLSKHSHNIFHVNLITAGCVNIETKKGIMTARTGDAFIIPPQADHELWSAAGYSQIGMDVKDVADEYGLAEKLHGLCQGQAMKVTVQSREIVEYMTEKVLTDLSPFSRLRCINRMSELLAAIIENADQPPEQSHFRTRFIKAASQCAQQGASLDELCSIMNFSKTHLERLTKKEFGCSVIEYTNKLRFLKICSLLTTTDKTLSAIAEECGFFDSSHLCVFFKKYSGKTPSSYRKEL